jgi:hypothetical protein
MKVKKDGLSGSRPFPVIGGDPAPFRRVGSHQEKGPCPPFRAEKYRPALLQAVDRPDQRQP